MSGEKKKVGNCTVGCSEEVINLVILVAGTTDPVNASTDEASRAMSYKNGHTYWDAKFYEDVKALVASAPNAKLFDLHGWSGDNRIANREAAGAYLVNRLIGANKEKAFYGPSYRKKKVHLHLVGHSHGGNVVNEMTKQMAKLGSKWPSTWKIKSFTYLSVPFFQKIHQVNVGSFVHPQAEVLNVYNHYDYTQQMLADFSLFTLQDAIRANNVTETISSSIKELLASNNAVPWKLIKDWWLNEKEGRLLYTRVRDFLGNTKKRDGFISVVQFLATLQKVFVGLNNPVEYQVNPGIQANHQVSTKSFKLLSDANLANFNTIIMALTKNINETVKALDDSIETNTFNRIDFGIDVLKGGVPLANNLKAFMDIPVAGLNVERSGVLWQTLISVLSDAIEMFDDTVNKPEAQFNGSRPITHLDVTTRDLYDRSAQKNNAVKLLGKIKVLEKKATAKPEANLLFDLLLTLMVHNPQVRDIAHMIQKWAERIRVIEENTPKTLKAADDVKFAANSLHTTMNNVVKALFFRFVGELEDPTDKTPSEIGQRGSLPYLLRESHSTSRRVLHPEVKAFLQRMMEH